MEIIGQAEPVHNCHEELPECEPPQLHPDRVMPGTLARCSCGITYVWEYYSYAGSYFWNKLENSSKWKASL